MRTLPYFFLVLAAGLSLASFLTSETLAEGHNLKHPPTIEAAL